ncbi:UDP-4-amino-4,6-dideoxy-N-acetyl-beta-L-altrosamine N-acetyltransferase [Campylobacter cuniculorum]|uniref:Formyltransferase n=1 Tax=Campylobacter cuniculorum DSM 23162 = LMG 24588 TaxID=1121267 RepID=A0A1W6BY21_9BACT|nr:UDP-4-amino-4,6-dideoxy-N-acetyl-beta-L-altrosamine N-acetyltransferase [Campylobacter cuniculorum]ARJ56930.1 formyltransferase [Campylobacter cuniculorum DSM 23162 = LMG 24588]
MKIAILTAPNQWFIPYAEQLAEKIPYAKLYFDSTEMVESFELVFILSYHKILDRTFLDKHKYNLVVHASALPKGKGWSPMFWQVLEGKREIVFSLFNASSAVDSGEIYLQETLHLSGLELYEELRQKQAEMCQKLCLEFLEKFPHLSPKAQSGEESFYPKRSPKDSELNPAKSLDEQFNLLRIVSNEEFPAFFYKDGKKFILKIYAESASSAGGGVISSLIIELENYVFLNATQQKEILNYRNDPRINANFYTRHTIGFKEHCAFVESLRGNLCKEYFVLRFHQRFLGSINFTKSKERAEFGFFGNPDISGMGRTLEQVSLFYAFYVLRVQELCLEVFSHNKQVINLHKKFGFQVVGEKSIKDAKVLLMSCSAGGGEALVILLFFRIFSWQKILNNHCFSKEYFKKYFENYILAKLFFNTQLSPLKIYKNHILSGEFSSTFLTSFERIYHA